MGRDPSGVIGAKNRPRDHSIAHTKDRGERHKKIDDCGETHASNGRPGMVALGLSETELRSEMDLQRPGKQMRSTLFTVFRKTNAICPGAAFFGNLSLFQTESALSGVVERRISIGGLTAPRHL
jgi:hypothetical protein